jgi:hypothetical protein
MIIKHCNTEEQKKKRDFYAEYGNYSGNFKPTVEEYKKRLREAEEDFSKRVRGIVKPCFDSYVKSGREFV